MSDTRPYPAPDEREERLEQLSSRAGATLLTIGQSVEGRPIRAAKIPAASQDPRRVLLVANIHGPEWIGVQVALGFLEAIGRRDAELVPLSARAEVWIVPCVNPDGYHRTFEQAGRGSLAELRTNAHGVDLNRNFPLPLGAKPTRFGFSGSSARGSPFYRGEHALSEPETQALDALLKAEDFHASASLHSNFGALIPARVLSGADDGAYRGLAAAYRSGQSSHRYPRLSSRWFDVFTGELEDHQHHARQTWAICVELFSIPASFRQHLLSPSLFWRFNPHDPEPWLQNDIPALARYFLAALELDRPAKTNADRIRPSQGPKGRRSR